MSWGYLQIIFQDLLLLNREFRSDLQKNKFIVFEAEFKTFLDFGSEIKIILAELLTPEKIKC
jgi:hypothetical protein